MKTSLFVAALLLSSTVPAFADGTVEQKTQFQLSGPLGGVINVFSRTAREGLVSTTAVKGDRKLTRTGDGGELIDLAEEKVYTIDFDRETYSVKTFAAIRKEWEEQQAKAKKEAAKASSKEKSEAPEYEVDFDVKSTGKKQTINGFSTRQEIATVTVREKGRKLEQSGGFVLTSDMWMAAKVPAVGDIADFDRRFVQKVYGPSFAADLRSMAAAVAMSPAFGKAMKAFQDQRSSFEGSPVRMNMKFETVAGTDAPKEEVEEEESDPSTAAAQAIGGLFNKMKNRRNADKKEEAQEEEATIPGRSKLFTSTTEVISASPSVADVSIPEGFRQK